MNTHSHARNVFVGEGEIAKRKEGSDLNGWIDSIQLRLLLLLLDRELDPCDATAIPARRSAAS